LKTRKTNGRGAAQDHEDRTAVRDRGRATAQDPEIRGSSHRSRPGRPMVEAPLKTMKTELPFGIGV
ncbi:unnamed protein product, partial [Musa textilis]